MRKDTCSLMFIKRFVLSKHGTNKCEASVHPFEVGILLPMLRDGETEAQSDYIKGHATDQRPSCDQRIGGPGCLIHAPPHDSTASQNKHPESMTLQQLSHQLHNGLFTLLASTHGAGQTGGGCGALRMLSAKPFSVKCS